MSRRHLGIAGLLGLALACAPTPSVAPETRETADAPAPVAAIPLEDTDGPVEVFDLAPEPRVSVVTFAPLDDGAIDEASVVVVTLEGSDEPIARIPSASVSDVRIDDGQRTVTWLERSKAGAATHLHTFDVATGVHLRFATSDPGWMAP